MKKLISMLLTVAVIFAMCVPMAAFATQEANTGKITVPDVENHTYDIYQILTGDVSDNGELLSNVKAGSAAVDSIDADAALTALNALKDSKDNREILDEVEKYVDFDKDPVKSNVAAGTAVTGLATGYYLVKDHSAAGNNDSDTTYLVALVGEDVTLNAKTGVPSVTKQVKDVNDSTSDAATWGDSADYDIGDTIEFQITGTLPSNYADYKEYYYQFTDTLEHMTVDLTSVKVYKDSVEDANDITSQFFVQSYDTGKTLVVKNVNLKAETYGVDGLTKDSKIIITYQAKLDADATVGNPGNTNKVKVTYSNNPNFKRSGTTGDLEDEDNPNSEGGKDVPKDPDDSDKNPPTGDTPEDTNVVFTYSLTVNKVDENEDALNGAGFTLSKYDAATSNWVTVGVKEASDTVNVFEWAGLDDGKYKLEETTTPDGYSTIKPIEFEVTATHSESGIDTLSTDVTTIAAATPSNGQLATTIENTPGKALPTTGGIGTTLFYVFGAILVLGAAVLLIARRRADAR